MGVYRWGIASAARALPFAFVLVLAVISVLAAIGAVLPDISLPRVAVVAPIAYFVTILAEVCAAFVLFAGLRDGAGRRSTLVLALAFAANAAVSVLAFVVLPMMPLDPPILEASLQTAIWLFVGWHVVAAAGSLAYAAVRALGDEPPPTARFAAMAGAIAIGSVVLIVALSFLAVDHLPRLVDGSLAVRYSDTPVGILVFGALALATYAAFRIDRPSPIDRALSLFLLALTLEFGLLALGQRRFTAPFYLGRFTLFVSATYLLVAAIRTATEAQIRLSNVETTLKRIASESAVRAGRLRALREIAPRMSQTSELDSNTILSTAAAALRPHKRMRGYFGHVDADGIVVDAVGWHAGDADAAPVADVVFTGAVIPIDNTIVRHLTDGEPIRAWDDLGTASEARELLGVRLGLRSCIGATTSIGEKRYFVLFFSTDAMTDDPFAEDDLAYVDVVASFFANRVSHELLFAQTQYQIEHDALTGLENRLHFRKILRDEVRSGRPFAIAFANIDDFRRVNEQEGSAIADELLVEIAAGLSAISPNDVVARMSGDEFGILLRGPRTHDEATAALAKYAAIFETPFTGGALDETHSIRISMSIGAARFPDDADSGEQLMRRAGVALDVAKTRGGSCTMIFDASMESILDDSRLRALEITDAIANDQFTLVYQPTFALGTRTIVGAEALIRWDHAHRGRLLPAEFVGFAERNGMIAPLSRWVVRALIRDIADTPLPAGFRIYFNLAAQMLDDIPFIAELGETLAAAPRLVDHLGIEVTETAAMQNVERSKHTIDLLRRWGIAVAIDDFGTGYSSLSYLKKLTVDMIKVDQSFIAGLPDDEQDCALAEMLLRITDRFGFTTLAEGIENEAQVRWLIDQGCRFGQGYLLAEPAPFADLMQRLAEADAA
jgi:diguanylate cyclase (GGDEF)-like protein